MDTLSLDNVGKKTEQAQVETFLQSREKEKSTPLINFRGTSCPLYATAGSSGADVKAHLEKSIIISPGETKAIPTGLCVELPECPLPGFSYELQVRPRSGLALKYGLTVLNSPGTIDADYRGEIKIILINHGKADFEVLPGMNIAQLVLCPVIRANYFRVERLGETIRGTGGFGSTGV